MLLQEQIEQQNRLDSMLHEQQLKAIGEHLQEFPDLQQHYHNLLLNEQLQRHEERTLLRERAQLQQQEELRRRHLAEQAMAQQKQGDAAHMQQTQTHAQPSNVQNATAARLRDLAAASLAGNAVKRSELEKRQFAKPDDDILPSKLRVRDPELERIRFEREKDQERDHQERPKHEELGTSERKTKQKRKGKVRGQKVAPEQFKSGREVEIDEDDDEVADSPIKPSVQALLDFASSSEQPSSPYPQLQLPQERVTMLGTLNDLLSAAQDGDKTDAAASTLVGIKKQAEWSDSEQEEDACQDFQIAVRRGEAINLPGFTSVLPQLPEEPALSLERPKKKAKFKTLLDDDSIHSKENGKSKIEHKKDAKVRKESDAKSAEVAIVEYPYPIDTWWPPVSAIRKERKLVGEPQDEDDFPDDPQILDLNSPFRANMPKIRERMGNEVDPGVLEKIPHCKIHRLLMKKRKNPSAPELVYCFQVTELYPNDIMVCCSHCGTWRHAACGGHYKPYSVRECMDTPFSVVCDRCHVEEIILRDFPVARKRIDRQRNEQIRRALATSSAMRQASFSKHGGTYKWPLGSVSATHIGGHTRSVHSRHDKAEKQWLEMATRLSRGGSYKRPKDQVKVRTKELERLLVSVEDAGKFKRGNSSFPAM